MSTHRLSQGKHIIKAVVAIGRALGYSVKTEYPVERRAHAPAVDVAWFSDDGDSLYPLMIFEIESAATNAMAANPTKVYGQSMEHFERPLFYFHVVVKTGDSSTRLDSLRGVFGAHNYRIYQLDASNTATTLLIDILHQHRRIRRELNIEGLLDVIDRIDDLIVDIPSIIEAALAIGLRGSYRQTLAIRVLAKPGDEHRSLFVGVLVRRDRLKAVDTGYETYVGQQWRTPIELAILTASGVVEPEAALDRLVRWQKNGDGLCRIGPHFALSYEYDQFVFCMAAPIWAHVAAITLHVRAFTIYVADQLDILVEGMAAADPGLSLFTAAWTLHVAASAGSRTVYDRARQHVNRHGGISRALLFKPPSILRPEDDPEWPAFWCKDAVPVPQLEEFIVGRRAIAMSAVYLDRVTLGLRALAVADWEDGWADDL